MLNTILKLRILLCASIIFTLFSSILIAQEVILFSLEKYKRLDTVITIDTTWKTIDTLHVLLNPLYDIVDLIKPPVITTPPEKEKVKIDKSPPESVKWI